MLSPYTERQKKLIASYNIALRRQNKNMAAAMEVFTPASTGICISCSLISTDPLYLTGTLKIANTNNKEACQ